tara:strand:+ start:2416 stop:3348 length:933 start_codon:yes stop_codon:yes gene_type:complete
MRISKPKFWDEKKSFYSFLFYPISIIIIFFIFLKKKIIKSSKFSIPVVCIGNIYLGGTGKTPTTIFLAEKILEKKINPVIIRKNYKTHHDEYSFIKKYFKNLIICSSRKKGIVEAVNKKFDIAILDDGFQDCSIKKDLNIICFNQKQLAGNGFVIPAGPLRESLNSLKKAHLIIINGKKDILFEKKLLKINQNLDIFYSNYEIENLNELKNKKLFAVAGIGNPKNFFDLLSQNNLDVEKKLSFPDHYPFSSKQIDEMISYSKKNNLQIVMTEKDYLRIKNFNISEVKYLKLSLRINEYKKLLDKIIKLND